MDQDALKPAPIPKKSVPFAKIKKGYRFRFDGDIFKKTGDNLAWELRDGRQYKEWAFQGDELCEPKGV
jgi:hypothetical protein